MRNCIFAIGNCWRKENDRIKNQAKKNGIVLSIPFLNFYTKSFVAIPISPFPHLQIPLMF